MCGSFFCPFHLHAFVKATCHTRSNAKVLQCFERDGGCDTDGPAGSRKPWFPLSSIVETFTFLPSHVASCHLLLCFVLPDNYSPISVIHLQLPTNELEIPFLAWTDSLVSPTLSVVILLQILWYLTDFLKLQLVHLCDKVRLSPLSAEMWPRCVAMHRHANETKNLWCFLMAGFPGLSCAVSSTATPVCWSVHPL